MKFVCYFKNQSVNNHKHFWCTIEMHVKSLNSMTLKPFKELILCNECIAEGATASRSILGFESTESTGRNQSSN